MRLTESKKKEMIQEIIGPVMDEKGLALTQCNDWKWVWEKDIGGIVEKVHLRDMDGRLSLYIGASLGEYGGSGNQLVETLEHPRTKWTEWTYWVYSEEKQLQLYENILLDMRDILVLHCDAILERKAEKRRNNPLKQKHYEQLREHYGQLVTEYREKLAAEGKDLSGVCEAIAEQVKVRIGMPIGEVEDDLVGYAALLSSELLRRYGGMKKIDEEGDIVLEDVGYKKIKKIFYPLSEIFKLWESKMEIESWKKGMKDFQDSNDYELMKGYNNFVNKPKEETTAVDVLEIIRQKKDFNRVYGIAMEKAVELLQDDVFTGEYFPGQLLEKIPEMDASFFELYLEELKAIVQDALEKSKNYEWLFDEQEGWFLNIVKAISRKLQLVKR